MSGSFEQVYWVFYSSYDFRLNGIDSLPTSLIYSFCGFYFLQRLF